MDKPNVLIVEDDESIRTMYETAMKSAGLSTLVAQNGSEGVQIALEHHPDVILMDIMMPEMDGHEAMQKIRLDVWGKKAKVVFLTNFTDAENVIRAVGEGSEEYIVKSHTEVKDVVNKVRTAMNM